MKTFFQRLVRRWIRPPKPFPGSEAYWIDRYNSGGDSGNGSYHRLAEFKAEVVNGWIREHGVASVIEFGCGDGNQLALADYPEYTGFDVSPAAVARCRERFSGDSGKRFRLLADYAGERAECALSLDVIFHLIEDDVYRDYMRRLFDAAGRFAIVYSSNTDDNEGNRDAHVRHRKFTDWVAAHRPEWTLRARIPNRFPYAGNNVTGSFADFYIYERKDARAAGAGECV